MRSVFDYQHAPGGPLPDISELGTARLHPHQQATETSARQIAQHVAEFRRLADLAVVLEQAVTALVIRIHTTTDARQREALAHSRDDLQRFKDELESLQAEHQRAIERLQPQKTPMRLDGQ